MYIIGMNISINAGNARIWSKISPRVIAGCVLANTLGGRKNERSRKIDLKKVVNECLWKDNEAVVVGTAN